MSCFELIIKMPFSVRCETKIYSKSDCKRICKRVALYGKKKVELPLFVLKCNIGMMMLYAVNFGKLFENAEQD